MQSLKKQILLWKMSNYIKTEEILFFAICKEKTSSGFKTSPFFSKEKGEKLNQRGSYNSSQSKTLQPACFSNFWDFPLKFSKKKRKVYQISNKPLLHLYSCSNVLLYGPTSLIILGPGEFSPSLFSSKTLLGGFYKGNYRTRTYLKALGHQLTRKREIYVAFLRVLRKKKSNFYTTLYMCKFLLPKTIHFYCKKTFLPSSCPRAHL